MPQKKILKILIADDDPDDRKLVDLAFKEAELDHTLNFVKNGQELMLYLEQIGIAEKTELPDLILLDLNMPGKDGRVALKEIKSNPKLQKLTIIIFSTCISEEDKAFISELGVNEFITKPPSFYELVHMIKNICDSVSCKNTLK